ncbi:MAG TPA: SDR family NAD(P)-dependent oxidoreductase [Candidatus Dormibacteraeota bacterium]|nr:SDR family NAD(P)-dependent oxidoreductase [Candidatus Dormibacteraeota bacterium]
MAKDKALHGKIVLITGASRGIGLATARRLASMGARVSLCGRDAKQLQSAATECKQAGSEALAVVADVTRPTDIANLIDTTERVLGPIEILINNAGIGYFAPVQDADTSKWNDVLDTNLKAVFLLSRAVAPGMIRMGRGHIVNIASLAGKNTFAGGAVYCASKWGLLGLTGCMAEDLRAHGIRVSAVCPGSVATDFAFPSGRDKNKMLQPDDVAHAVAAILTQAPQSFISEVLLRPTQKP